MLLLLPVLFLTIFPVFSSNNIWADATRPDCILRLNDLLVSSESPQKDAFLQFRNVQLLSFDGRKRQACDENGKAEIHVPGWLQLLSGEIFVRKPLPALGNLSKSLELSLTLEQDSFLVGQICERGQSQSAFLSDDFCSPRLCEFLPNACNTLANNAQLVGQTIPFSALFPSDGWLPLEEPLFHPMLAGLWRAEAELVAFGGGIEEGELLAKLGVEGWHLLRASDDDAQHLEEEL